MDAIKKKMQAMKMEKDAAMDKADTCEGQAKDANARADKVLEDVRELTKKLAQVEQDLATTKQNLEQANKDLEEKEKNLANVSALAYKRNPQGDTISSPNIKLFFCFLGFMSSASIRCKFINTWPGLDKDLRYLSIPDQETAIFW